MRIDCVFDEFVELEVVFFFVDCTFSWLPNTEFSCAASCSTQLSSQNVGNLRISRPNCEESSAATLNSLILAFQLNNGSRQTFPRNGRGQIGLRPRPIWQSSEFFSSNYFQIGQHVVLLHLLIAAKFQPGGWAKISARAETRHVIGPSDV